jgi:NAD(P)-dependent dehydrogenase (short-subunit alcohol dehydrogenase family)
MTSETKASMSGKTVLVTGATNGIGKATALELARMGAQVVLVGRSRPKTEATVSEVFKKTGNNALDYIVADLALMSGVRHAADAFRQKYDRLHVLINNVGGIFAQREVTSEGLEMTFALNHISYFLLTNLLLDVLKASAPTRVVNVSSDAHRFGGLNVNDLQSEQTYGMGGFRAYGQSKLMNVMFTYELAQRLEGTGVTANAMHPGAVATGFGRNNRGLIGFIFRSFGHFSLTPEQGADTVVYLASSPDVDEVTGKYFDRRKAVLSSSHSYDEAASRRLWEVSAEMTGIAVPQPAP